MNSESMAAFSREFATSPYRAYGFHYYMALI